MSRLEIEGSLVHCFGRHLHAGKRIEGAELFGATEGIAGVGTSKDSRPRWPTRLMVSLLYLKDTCAEEVQPLGYKVGRQADARHSNACPR